MSTKGPHRGQVNSYLHNIIRKQESDSLVILSLECITSFKKIHSTINVKPIRLAMAMAPGSDSTYRFHSVEQRTNKVTGRRLDLGAGNVVAVSDRNRIPRSYQFFFCIEFHNPINL